MVRILYKPAFVRAYKKLPTDLQDEIKEKIEIFKKNPNASNLKVHKLKGRLKDFWSFSVNYRYRIIFIKERENYVLLVVGDHDVYR